MALEFHCEHCGSRNQVNFLKRGEFVKCSRCGKITTVPEDAIEIATVSDTPRTTNINPYLHFWFHPRATIRQVIDQDRFMEALLIVVATAVLNTLCSMTMNSQVLGGAYAMMSSMFGFIFAVIGFLAIGAIYWVAGKVMGSKAQIKDILTAMGWASLPNIIPAILLPFFLGSAFSEAVVSGNPESIEALFSLPLILLFVVFAIYALVILVISLSEAYGFTIGRTIGTILLIIATFAVLFIVTAVMCLALFKGMSSPAAS